MVKEFKFLLVLISFISTCSAQSIKLEFGFDISEYLKSKYHKGFDHSPGEYVFKFYKPRFEETDVYEAGLPCGHNSYFRVVRDYYGKIVGYNILGGYVYQSGYYPGHFESDPHFISFDSRSIIENQLVLDQLDSRIWISIKPQMEDYYAAYIKIDYSSVKEWTIFTNLNDNKNSILFSLDNLARAENDQVIKIRLENSSSKGDSVENCIFIYSTNSGDNSEGLINSKGYKLFLNDFSKIEYLKTEKNLKYFKVKRYNVDKQGYRSDDTYGIVTSNGKYIIEPNFSSLDVSNYEFEKYGYCKIIYNDKCGLIDKRFNIVVEPVYEKIILFDEFKKYAVVKTKYGDFNERVCWKFINLNSNEIFGRNFQEILISESGYFPIKLNNKWGFCNRYGQVIIEPKYNFVSGFNEGVSFASMNVGKSYLPEYSCFLINPKGVVLASLNRSLGNDLVEVGVFSEGLMLFQSRKSGLFGFIDKKGLVAIPAKFESVSSFSGGKSFVKLYGSEFYIDKNGKRIDN